MSAPEPHREPAAPDQEPRHRPHHRAQERTGRSAQINVKRLAIAFEFVVVRHLDVRHRCFGRQMHQGNERLSRLRGCGTVDPDAAGGGLDRRSGTGLGKLRRKLRYLFFPDTGRQFQRKPVLRQGAKRYAIAHACHGTCLGIHPPALCHRRVLELL